MRLYGHATWLRVLHTRAQIGPRGGPLTQLTRASAQNRQRKLNAGWDKGAVAQGKGCEKVFVCYPILE